MSATRLDITIEQGTDFNQIFAIPDSIGSLVGAQAAMQIRKEVDDPLALATLTTWDTTLILNTSDRTLKPVIDEELSASLPSGACVYDIRLQTADGTTTRPYEGSAIVKADVTRIAFPAPAPSPAPSPSPLPNNALVTDDGQAVYVSDDGQSIYVLEN